MQNLLIISVIITFVNIIFYSNKRWIEYKDGQLNRNTLETFLVIVVLCIPFINIFAFILYFWYGLNDLQNVFEDYLRIKKNPELTSFDLLKNIQARYLAADISLCDNESCVNRYCRDEEHHLNEIIPIIFLIEFKRNLSEVVEFLETNHNQPNASHILLSYEVTFSKITSVLNESWVPNEGIPNEILLGSKISIEHFITEIQQAINMIYEVKKEVLK